VRGADQFPAALEPLSWRAGFTGYGDVEGFNSGNRNWPLLGTVDYHFNDWLVVPRGSAPGPTPDMIREQDVQRLEQRSR
jgi:hypothetical protein